MASYLSHPHGAPRYDIELLEIQMHLVKQLVTISSTSLSCAMARQSMLTKSLLYHLKEGGINCNFCTTLVSRAHTSKLGSWRGLGLVRGLSSAAGFALGYFTPSKCHDLFLALLVLSALLALTGSHFHPLLLPMSLEVVLYYTFRDQGTG